jgi:hypothetical protein
MSGNQERTFDDVLECKRFILSNGKDILSGIIDENGYIDSFWTFNESSPDFLIELIGYCIEDKDFIVGILDNGFCIDDEDYIKWLNENTFFEELEKVA